MESEPQSFPGALNTLGAGKAGGMISIGDALGALSELSLSARSQARAAASESTGVSDDEALRHEESADIEAQRKRVRERVNAALAIEDEHAAQSGALVYSSRVFAQISLPYRDPGAVARYVKTNGNLSLSILATSPRWGIPFGVIPRRIMLYIATKAVRERTREIDLSTSQRAFMREIQSGGGGRAAELVQDQAERLFRSLICIDYEDSTGKAGQVTRVSESERLLLTSHSFSLWKEDDGRRSWASRITISQDYYDHLVAAPVPLDQRIVLALGAKPLSIDIYTWLAYRVFTLRRAGGRVTKIPWEALARQFSPERDATDAASVRAFRSSFLQAIKLIAGLDPDLGAGVDGDSFDRGAQCLVLKAASAKTVRQVRRAQA